MPHIRRGEAPPYATDDKRIYSLFEDAVSGSNTLRPQNRIIEALSQPNLTPASKATQLHCIQH